MRDQVPDPARYETPPVAAAAAADDGAVAGFLAANPDVTVVDLLLPDLSGILRGKKMPATGLAKLFRDGITLPGSVYGMDVTGATVEATGLGLKGGDADRICRPVPGRLARVPWCRRPTAQALLRMTDLDGGPFFADPRALLERMVAHLAARGLSPVVALELEFYLIDADRAETAPPQPPAAPRGGRRAAGTQVYGLDELDAFDDVLTEIQACCRSLDIAVDSAVAEYAPAQYEINLKHRLCALTAADDAVLFKRVVKQVAAAHGLAATFMSKPYADLAGSGLHVHLSLVDAAGRNVFAADEPAGSPVLAHAIGGLLDVMTEGHALFAQNQNAYRRFQRNCYVPQAPTWGVNNRTVAVRVPHGPADQRRLEHRVAGADANPYLVVATLLAGIVHGLDGRLDPGPPATGDAGEGRPPAFGSSWAVSLDRLASSRFYGEVFGRRFLDAYLAVKRAERDRFHSLVSPVEHQWYLERA